MSDDTALSPWQRIVNKALEQIPQMLVAAIAALVAGARPAGSEGELRFLQGAARLKPRDTLDGQQHL